MYQKKQRCTCGKTKNPPYCDHSHECKDALPLQISPIPKKILLLMLPFWDPLVPPQGISHLKNFLQQHGYTVKSGNANTRAEFKELYNKYFALLKDYVPGNKQGNFFNIGHDVMRNHMISHIHYDNEKEYKELVKAIVYNTYYTHLNENQVCRLNEVLTLFYSRLESYILQWLSREKPVVLGISVLRDSIGPSMFAFRLTKEKYPFIRTVMGGSVFSDHLRTGTPNFDSFLEKTPYIDKIIIGEGQNLFLRLLKGQLPESQRVFTLKDIDGETLGFSSLNLPDMTDFSIPQDYPYLSGQASVSCPYQCSFCNVVPFYGKYREKDPKLVVEEMTALYKTYGMQLFFMNDALLNMAASAISQTFLESGISLYWDGYLRVDKAICDPANTLLWRRGGFYRARLGVESGSQHMLDLMHKKITPDQTREALFNLANAGVKTTTYWVIGHPGETEEDFRQTLDLVEEVKDYIFEAECNPFIYGFSGQSDSERWQGKRKPLYTENVKNMLVMQTGIVAAEPSREVTYQRVSRFAQHCDRLGIPNPYSLHEIYQADKHWQKLHKNGVPSLADFKRKGVYIDECRSVKELLVMPSKLENDGDFGF